MTMEPCPKSAPKPESPAIRGRRLRDQLLGVLRDLPFTALMRCVGELMAADGYANVRLSGRVGYRGRNRDGGHDLEAYRPSPLDAEEQTGRGTLRRKALVQVKQYDGDTRVHQRAVDALRGACLRSGAIEGVLVTTSDFSAVVRKAEANLRRHGGDAVAPVHLIDGPAFADRLVLHGIGVRTRGGRSEVDRDYFAALGADGRMPVAAQRPERQSPGVTASVTKSAGQLTLTLPFEIFVHQ